MQQRKASSFYLLHHWSNYKHLESRFAEGKTTIFGQNLKKPVRFLTWIQSVYAYDIISDLSQRFSTSNEVGPVGRHFALGEFFFFLLYLSLLKATARGKKTKPVGSAHISAIEVRSSVCLEKTCQKSNADQSKIDWPKLHALLLTSSVSVIQVCLGWIINIDLSSTERKREILYWFCWQIV